MTWPIIIRLPAWPRTTTVLAIGFLVGCLLYTPMIAFVGKFIQPEFRQSVEIIVGLFKDGMLLILGYFFARPATSSADPGKTEG